MSQRTAMLVATTLTVFVVITIVGVVWQLFQKSTVDTLALQVAPQPPTTQLTGATQAVTGPTDAEVAQREAAYQQLIQQANQRLEESYKQQQELTKELAAEKSKQAAAVVVPASAPAQENLQPKYNLSSDQAAALALQAEKGAVLVKPADLISFQGTAAYEVTLDRGVVYIDANTGKVLYDSAVVIVVHDSGGGGGNSGGGSPQAAAPKTKSGHESENESHTQGTGNHVQEQHTTTSTGQHSDD
jgi:uncharacterized membrane protein YkoI